MAGAAFAASDRVRERARERLRAGRPRRRAQQPARDVSAHRVACVRTAVLARDARGGQYRPLGILSFALGLGVVWRRRALVPRRQRDVARRRDRHGVAARRRAARARGRRRRGNGVRGASRARRGGVERRRPSRANGGGVRGRGAARASSRSLERRTAVRARPAQQGERDRVRGARRRERPAPRA